jgi:hypothetical protein
MEGALGPVRVMFLSFVSSDSIPALHLTNAALVGTSLEGTRSAQDFLGLVKMVIRPDDFHLISLKEGHVVSTEGTIGPGDYVIGTQVLSYIHSPEYQHFLPHSWP